MQPSEIIGTSGVQESPWWVLYTRHQHEKVIADMLTAKGFEIFLPLYDSVRRWKDRRKVLSLPLFPCYVFVRGGFDRRLQVVSTPGIHMILSHGEKIATVPEPEIEAIRRIVQGRLRAEPHPFLKCGDRVRVIRGALRGVEGFLVRRKNLCRLVLSVNMLAQSVGVEVDALDVEPVAAQTPAAQTQAGLPPQLSAGSGALSEPLPPDGGRWALDGQRTSSAVMAGYLPDPPHRPARMDGSCL